MAKRSHKPADLNRRAAAVVAESTDDDDDDLPLHTVTVTESKHAMHWPPRELVGQPNTRT